uniref:Uncharacterized protein n=2 Tax=Branchiostoma floridae TaxID=7739 RepID=C3ZK64_BRAFL|eukprot:XP_002590952.1 hypothetical protein BRAFLDRAFT_129572 [Branchiostoma floridae]
MLSPALTVLLLMVLTGNSAGDSHGGRSSDRGGNDVRSGDLSAGLETGHDVMGGGLLAMMEFVPLEPDQPRGRTMWTSGRHQRARAGAAGAPGLREDRRAHVARAKLGAADWLTSWLRGDDRKDNAQGDVREKIDSFDSVRNLRRRRYSGQENRIPDTPAVGSLPKRVSDAPPADFLRNRIPDSASDVTDEVAQLTARWPSKPALTVLLLMVLTGNSAGDSHGGRSSDRGGNDVRSGDLSAGLETGHDVMGGGLLAMMEFVPLEPDQPRGRTMWTSGRHQRARAGAAGAPGLREDRRAHVARAKLGAADWLTSWLRGDDRKDNAQGDVREKIDSFDSVRNLRRRRYSGQEVITRGSDGRPVNPQNISPAGGKARPINPRALTNPWALINPRALMHPRALIHPRAKRQSAEYRLMSEIRKHLMARERKIRLHFLLKKLSSRYDVEEQRKPLEREKLLVLLRRAVSSAIRCNRQDPVPSVNPGLNDHTRHGGGPDLREEPEKKRRSHQQLSPIDYTSLLMPRLHHLYLAANVLLVAMVILTKVTSSAGLPTANQKPLTRRSITDVTMTEERTRDMISRARQAWLTALVDEILLPEGANSKRSGIDTMADHRLAHDTRTAWRRHLLRYLVTADPSISFPQRPSKRQITDRTMTEERSRDLVDRARQAWISSLVDEIVEASGTSKRQITDVDVTSDHSKAFTDRERTAWLHRLLNAVQGQ